MEETRVLHEEIEEMIEKKQFKELCILLKNINPVDIADAFDGLSEKDTILIYRLLPKEAAADVFVSMEPEMQELLIKSFKDSEIKDVVNDLYLDDAVDIIEEMPAVVVARILKNADADMRKMINEILLYPEDSAGSIMTPEYVSLKKDMTVADAFDRIRKTGLDKETVYTCYVTENRKLVGIISIKKMLISEKTSVIGDIMRTSFISVKTTDDKEYVATQIKKYGFLAIPVVDNEERLVGIVTIDDAIGVIEDEATEDIEKMAAILPSERPYTKTGVFKTWAQRIPWLLLLMVSATFTSRIILSFENALAACASLTAFIPMLMDTGGNAGSQSAVTIIRGLSLGDIELRDVLKIAWKEIRVAILCALTLMPVTFLKAMYIDGMSGEPGGILISLTVAITLMFTVTIAKLVGSMLPLLAKLVRLDPAVTASPFITTIVDALSLIVYFAISTKLLNL